MAEFTITWKNKETGEIFHDKVNVSTNGNLWDGKSAARRAWLNELKQNNDTNQRYDLFVQHGEIVEIDKATYWDSERYTDLRGSLENMKQGYQSEGIVGGAKEAPRVLGKALFNGGLFALKAAMESVRQTPDVLAKATERQMKHKEQNGTLNPEEKQQMEERIARLKGKVLWKNERIDD